MISTHKSSMHQRPVPAVEFDKFLKLRSQKQSLILSHNQPIHQKVKSFQQLLKLTKTGSTINLQPHHKPRQNTQIKNKSESTKSINVLNGLNDFQMNRFEDIESDQAQMKKLNRMVFGISQWQENNQKPSQPEQRKIKHAKTSHQNRQKQQIVQKQASKQIRQRKRLAYSSCDGKNFRKFYVPFKKHQTNVQLNQMNSNFTKTSSYLNYPKALLDSNLLGQNQNRFSQLKNRIKLLQNKAKNQYGLQFDHQSNLKKNQNYIWNDSKDTSQIDCDLDFSQLQLGPILNKQCSQKYSSFNRRISQKQNTFFDGSVPQELIEVVQNNHENFHQFRLRKSKDLDPQRETKGKLKKGYLSRPKTFKPTYTYIQI